MDDDSTDTDDAADGQRTRITHEHLGGEGIIPQETDHRTDEGTEKHHQLLGVRDVHNVEIRGVADV